MPGTIGPDPLGDRATGDRGDRPVSEFDLQFPLAMVQSMPLLKQASCQRREINKNRGLMKLQIFNNLRIAGF